MGLSKIKGVIQVYSWGGTEYIPRLVGLELINHTRFGEIKPKAQFGDRQPDGIEQIYKRPVQDSGLSKLNLADNEYQCEAETLEIMIVIEGQVTASSADQTVVLEKGLILVVSAGTRYQPNETSSEVYKVKCSVA